MSLNAGQFISLAITGAVRSAGIREWGLFPLVFIAALVPSGVLAAASFQSHASLRGTVKTYLQERLSDADFEDAEISVGRMDSRLKLARCKTGLETFLPTGQHLIGNVTIGVRCNEPKPWSIYIPATVTVYEDVLAASRPLLRGHQLTASDIMVVRKKLNPRERAFFQHHDRLINMVVKRNIAAGKIFSPQLLQAPRLVQRGEEVILVAESKSLTVRMVGKALADGSKGDVIQVRNSVSKRIVEGIVTRQGVVRVKM